MYERSVIVLERYTEDILGLNKSNNLKNNCYTYKDIIEEEKVYKEMLEEEDEVIKKFEEIAEKIQKMQRSQEILYKNNKALEEERYSLFYDFETEPETIEKKLICIENENKKNDEELQNLRKEYIEALEVFNERQIERNNCARKKKGVDRNHVQTIEKTRQMFEMIDVEDVKKIKSFINNDKSKIKEKILNIMIENGKNEKVPFDKDVLSNSIDVRIDIATREAQCYILVYERLRRLLNEVENDNILLARYEKILRDVDTKLNFLNAEKEYIVGFLDNERMTSMNGTKIHRKMMRESCKKFEADINQIDNLYELLIRETTNKSTKKAYNQLYNSTYLKDIEEKEKDFEKEMTNVRVRAGVVINSNYWRIENIKNIYTVFRTEVTEKFGKDLSVYDIIEEQEETVKQKDKDFDYIGSLYSGLETEKATNSEVANTKGNIQDDYIDDYYDDYEDDDEIISYDDDDEFDDYYDEDDELESIDNFDLFYDDDDDDDDYEDEFFDGYDDDDDYDDDEYEDYDEEDEYEDELENAFDNIDEEDYDLNFDDFDDQTDYEEENQLEKIRNARKIQETPGNAKRKLRIKRATVSNNNSSANDIMNNVNKINEVKDSNNSKSIKRKKSISNTRNSSNNTSNTDFSNYLNNVLKQQKVEKDYKNNLDEMIPGGITEITPKSSKKKSKGFFNKLRKTNKAIKDTKALKNS